jgi:hypothetical protein
MVETYVKLLLSGLSLEAIYLQECPVFRMIIIETDRKNRQGVAKSPLEDGSTQTMPGK